MHLKQSHTKLADLIIVFSSTKVLPPPALEQGHPSSTPNTTVSPDFPSSTVKQTNVLLIAGDIFVLSTEMSFFQPFVLSSHSVRHFLLGVDFAVMGFFNRPCCCFLSERKGCKHSMDYLLNSRSCFERLFFPFECLIMVLLSHALCLKEVKLLKK